jgi:hypothetical protein
VRLGRLKTPGAAKACAETIRATLTGLSSIEKLEIFPLPAAAADPIRTLTLQGVLS